MDDFLEASWACLPGSGALGRAPRPLRPMTRFFRSSSEAMFFDLGWILEDFWEAKMVPISILESFFFDVVFECALASILNRFLEARNLKNHEKPLLFLWFLLIFIKSICSKQ